MKKKHERSSGGRGGAHGRKDNVPRRYACAEPGCGADGTAAEMKNLGCDPSALDMHALLALVRCASCAERQPDGTRTYRLSHTLGAMRKHRFAPKVEDGKVDEKAYLRWILRGKKDRVVREYAERYGALPYYGDPASAEREGILYPEERLAPDGSHLCGLPIPCCDKRSPAARFLTVLGDVVGICKKASAIFFDVRNAHAEEAQFRKLLSTDDLSAAKTYAARWLRGGRR